MNISHYIMYIYIIMFLCIYNIYTIIVYIYIDRYITMCMYILCNMYKSYNI